MIVTRENYPHLHAAFLEIELDNGGHHVNRIAAGQGLPEPIDLERFEVPEAWSHLTPGADLALGRLQEGSDVDFETFVCGDQDEAEAIEKRQGDLAEARILLNDWFNGWQPEDAPYAIPSTASGGAAK